MGQATVLVWRVGGGERTLKWEELRLAEWEREKPIWSFKSADWQSWACHVSKSTVSLWYGIPTLFFFCRTLQGQANGHVRVHTAHFAVSVILSIFAYTLTCTQTYIEIRWDVGFFISFWVLDFCSIYAWFCQIWLHFQDFIFLKVLVIQRVSIGPSIPATHNSFLSWDARWLVFCACACNPFVIQSRQ